MKEHPIEFAEQLRVLKHRVFTTQAPACFIAQSPGEFNTSHFIFGILIGENLLVINPLGAYGSGNSKAFLAGLAEQKLQGIVSNIYISEVLIQQDVDCGVHSCGPICTELMRYSLQLTATELQQRFQACIIQSGTRLEFGFKALKEIDNLLPKSLQQLMLKKGKPYEEAILAIRNEHSKILQRCTVTGRTYFSNDLSFEQEFLSIVKQSKESITAIKKKLVFL
jgi:hypothetical protein